MLYDHDPGDECTVGPCIDCGEGEGNCFGGRCEKCHNQIMWLDHPLPINEEGRIDTSDVNSVSQ